MRHLSVITIVRNRAQHLARLIAGVAASDEAPRELIVVDMSDRPVIVPELAFPTRRIQYSTDHLALAAARNIGANAAEGRHLLFLDVDCIPRRELVAIMDDVLQDSDSLICPEVRYLGPDTKLLTDDSALESASLPHPLRSFPKRGCRVEANAGLFWSLTFGIRRSSFKRLGGFDIGYKGYGAEDTDFGFRARDAGLPLLFVGGTGSFHQHHGVVSPPLQHLNDIVQNANRFYRRWGIWPMAGWLQQFEKMHLVAFVGNELQLIRDPTSAEMKAATQPPSVYF